jgi:hypothetical protein
VLTTFGLGFAPHLQRKARTELRWRAHAIDMVWPLARAPVAAFYRMRRGGQQCILKTRAGFCSRGGTKLLPRLPAGGAPLDVPPHRGQWGAGGLGPPAPLAPRGHLF